MGDIDGALSDAEKLIELDPKNPEAYTQRAFVRRRQKNYDGAIADLTKAVELKPPNIYAIGWRALTRLDKGHALEAAGQHEQAVEAWNQAIADQRLDIEADPKSAIKHADLSTMLPLIGDTAGSAAAFTQAVKLQPRATSNFFFHNKSLPAYNKRNWKAALGHLRRAIAADPLKPGVDHHFVWMARSWLGEQEAATAELAATLDGKKASFSEQETLIARFFLGRISEEDFIKSAELADEKKTRERRCEVFCYAAEKRLIAGDKAGARALFQRCADLDFKASIESHLAKTRLADLEKK
jgi:tetratricopeptide (TPR) repeat protein